MKRVLFKRILISYLIIAPILFISLELYLSHVVKTSHIKRLQESLLIQAHLIADRVPSSSALSLDDFCRKYKETTGARITLIDSSGRVLGDSDEPSARMDNHSKRPEIMDASVSGIGSSVRFSRTVQKDLLYLAVAVNRDSGRVFVRLSVPLHAVEAETGKIGVRILIPSLIALLAAILIGLIQTRSITKSVEEITLFSREVAGGNLEKRLFLKGKGEIGELAKNINDMALELKTRLRQSEEEKLKVEAILENLSEGLMLIDPMGEILLCNRAVQNLFNIQTDIKGKTLAETLKSAELMEIVKKTTESREPLSHEITITYPKETCLIVTAMPFYPSSGKEAITGVVLTLHDITRLKRLEEMRKDFVANVSHEIKTPITAIRGFAETLLGGAIDDRENAFKFLETIKKHSERLNSLVNDLLIISGIELGDMKLEKLNLDIAGVIDTVFTTLKDKADSKGLFLKKALPSESMNINADKDRLTQILLNLVDNGIKFTEQGGVTAGIKKTDGKRVLFIEDTGAGIPKKNLSRLGERFYRVDSTRSRELGGTGLGLAIVKHLVKAHGWEMTIESTQGKGTKVKIWL